MSSPLPQWMMPVVIIGAVFLLLVIRYVINKGVDTAANAIREKRKKAEKPEPHVTENLADRFKK